MLQQESGLEVNSQGSNHRMWDSGAAGGSLTYCATMPTFFSNVFGNLFNHMWRNEIRLFIIYCIQKLIQSELDLQTESVKQCREN